jgi:hypothetical protein
VYLRFRSQWMLLWTCQSGQNQEFPLYKWKLMAGELEVFDGGGYKPTITIFPKRKISKSSGGVVYKMLIPFEDCNKLLQIFKGK